MHTRPTRQSESLSQRCLSDESSWQPTLPNKQSATSDFVGNDTRLDVSTGLGYRFFGGPAMKPIPPWFLWTAVAAGSCARAPAHPCTTDVECGVGWSCRDLFCQEASSSRAADGGEDGSFWTDGPPGRDVSPGGDGGSHPNYMFV